MIWEFKTLKTIKNNVLNIIKIIILKIINNFNKFKNIKINNINENEKLRLIFNEFIKIKKKNIENSLFIIKFKFILTKKIKKIIIYKRFIFFIIYL